MKHRQWVLSVGVFVLIMGARVRRRPRARSVQQSDLRRQRHHDLGLARLELGNAIVTAIRYQSIDNAPLLIFATVGAVLFLFMVRT